MTTQERETIHATALTRFAAIAAEESDNRRRLLENLHFVYDIDEGQWPATIRAEREKEGRPCLTTNKLRKFVSVVANQAVQNRPAIGIRPVDDQSDPLMARVHEDIIRNQEYQSSADRIYAKAVESAIAGNVGYWRILTRYLPGTFEQEAYLAPIPNPCAAYLDRYRNYGFVRTSMTKEAFAAKYPKAAVTDFSQASTGDIGQHWVDSERIIVAEYFWKTPATRTIAQIRDAQTDEVQTVTLGKDLTADAITAGGYQVVQQRVETTWTVKWAVLTGAEILDVRDWPGDEIPIIEIVGDQQEINGRVYKRSLIEDGKDPMRMYNYWNTSMTETIALVPKAPYLVTPQEIQGFEAMWNDANVKNLPYLLFNSAGGRIPSRERPPDLPSAAMAMLKLADQDIKDTIGIFEPIGESEAAQAEGNGR